MPCRKKDRPWGQGAGCLLGQDWDPDSSLLPDPHWGQGKKLHKAPKNWLRLRYRAKPGPQPSAWQTTQGCPSGSGWRPPASRSTENRGCTPEEMCHGHKHQPMPRRAALLPSQPPHRLLAGCSGAAAACEDGSVGSCAQGVCDGQHDKSCRND